MPERQIPSLIQWLEIQWRTDKKTWTISQKKMMERARRHHALRGSIAAVMMVAIIFIGLVVRNRVEERRLSAEASRLVEGLLLAETSQVPNIIDSLTDYRQFCNDDLRKAFSEWPDDSNAKLHAAMALLPEDPSVMPFLEERLLRISPSQFQPVRDLLQDHMSEITTAYWQIAKDRDQDPARRFQAACALATYDTQNESWQDDELVDFLANHLVGVLPSELLPWRNALSPVKALLTSPLAAIYRDTDQDLQVRGLATDTLAGFLSDDAEGLFDLLADANEKQFGPIYGKLSDHRNEAIELANAELAKTLAKDASETDKEDLAIRQANAAVMLLRMDRSENVWPWLKHSPDPRVRSYIIHWLSPRGGVPQAIIARYETETDVTIKRALLLCLGEFDASDLADSQRQALIETLLNVYRADPDAGLHGAAEWLLRKWGQAEKLTAIEDELRQNEEQIVNEIREGRQWYVNKQGQTFVCLDADEFYLGSPESEEGHNSQEIRHQVRIDRRFAIRTKVVTKADWRRFRLSEWERSPDYEYIAGREEDAPMVVTWYEAAWYCNWLSEQEGIPEAQWCFEPNEDGVYGPGMRAKTGFLELRGYRLPTEAEWEFACRAGTETARYFGETVTLLPKYAWYQENSVNAMPVGLLKPNDFGLFDMHGNTWETCFDAFTNYPTSTSEEDLVVPDLPEEDAVSNIVDRVLRGGAYDNRNRQIRSAQRFGYSPGAWLSVNGLRPARTLPK